MPVIQVRGLSKKYRLGATVHHHTLREALGSWASSIFRPGVSASGRAASDGKTIWALKDVSFDVARGEIVGIIGRNGAGKTTLLKILSRITEPSEGEAKIRGSFRSLLEVGTGFHPELTGRENIFLNGAVLGMRRAETRRRFDEIVAFAEVEEFIDTPVKRYSSGMYVRLAFAVAAHLEPDILLVDEVLAVGDVMFQRKCVGAMGRAAGEGKTVLVVSHNMATINQLCSRCILLADGKVVTDGHPKSVVLEYLGADRKGAGSEVVFAEDRKQDYQILGARLADRNGRTLDRSLGQAESFQLEASFSLRRALPDGYALLWIRNELGEVVLTSDSRDVSTSVEFTTAGIKRVRLQFPGILAAGRYFVSVTVAQEPRGTFDARYDVLSFRIEEVLGARHDRPGCVYLPLEWSGRHK